MIDDLTGKMFSRILSRNKKTDGSSPTIGGQTHAAANARRPGDKESPQIEGPRAILFQKSASERFPARNANSRSPAPQSPSEARGGVFEADNRLLNIPKSMQAKKASEPNVLSNSRSRDQFRKSNSQPTLNIRRSADISRTNRKKKDDDRGFLDRAFENAVSLAFEESGESQEDLIEGQETTTTTARETSSE